MPKLRVIQELEYGVILVPVYMDYWAEKAKVSEVRKSQGLKN
jgi:hypothetical protein